MLTEASRAANFTNELGVDGTVRYLRNVMGLWVLQESIRTWDAAGLPADLADLLAAAAGVPALTTVVDLDDPAFLPPGDMPARIADAAARTGQTPPQSQAETVRCILDSLALAYRRAVREAAELAGRRVGVVHVVGGGVRNELLCQLTADATGLPVVAGPVEAAALGNVLVQARAAGVLDGDLAALRAVGPAVRSCAGTPRACSSATRTAGRPRPGGCGTDRRRPPGCGRASTGRAGHGPARPGAAPAVEASGRRPGVDARSTTVPPPARGAARPDGGRSASSVATHARCRRAASGRC